MSRGLERETIGQLERREALVSDETTNRGFWHHYRAVMSSATEQPVVEPKTR